MISKNLFFKLMKEDLKRRIWAVCLAFICFFFWMPVMAAMGFSSLSRQVQEWSINGVPSVTMTMEELRAEHILMLMRNTLGFRNYAVPFIVAGAAVVLGITGFSWLHSRKKVDFYHSIPVRRELLFMVKYLDGILIVFSMYFVNLILCCGIFSLNGTAMSQTFLPGFTAMLVHLVNFILIYSVALAAVLMTGNFFISILGMLVFFCYVPLIGILLQGLSNLFFTTILGSSKVLSFIVEHGSPVGYYIRMVADGGGLRPDQYVGLIPDLAVPLAIAMLLTAFCLFLYRLRPSEAAGRAMAFSVSRAPIKILVVTPVTIAMAILFWNIYDSLGWAAFGFLFGLAVTHCTIEILYHFDFRKLFANLPHAGICAVVALAVIGVFRYDLVGYDRYFPSESSFDSAALYIAGLNNWGNGSYGLPVKREDSMEWKYISEDEFAENNMELTDYAGLKSIAECGIREAEQSKEERFGRKGTGNAGENQTFMSYITVVYRLKNGREVQRRYFVSMEELKDTLETLYMQREYKDGVYPVLSYSDSDLYGVYMYKENEIRPVSGDEAAISGILAAYQEDMRNLTLRERCSETPVCALRFLTAAEKEYLGYVSASRHQSYTGNFEMEDMEEVNFFPVYPSFSATIEALQEAGMDPLEGLCAEDVSRIVIEAEIQEPAAAAESAEVYDEAAWTSGQKSFEIVNDSPENRKKIEEILDSSVEWGLALYNGLQAYEGGVTVNVYPVEEDGETFMEDQQKYIQYIFAGDTVPESVREMTGYGDTVVQYINPGLSEIWGD